MRGAHRGPAGASAGKNARWLAVLAALVIGPIAVIAGVIWFFENATDLELSAVLLILGTAGLVKALVEGNLVLLWSGAGVVVSSGWRVVSDVTHHLAGGLAGFLVGAVTLVCFGVGFVLLIKDGSLGQVWKALRARLASGPGDHGPTGPG
jgi:hypothetical protein